MACSSSAAGAVRRTAVLDIRTTEAVGVGDGPQELSKRSVLVAVLRRGGPKMIEASVVPAVLFWVCLVFGSLGLAYAAAVAWLYGCLAGRMARGRRVSQVLVLSVIGITVRTTVAVASGSSFMYFAQPILGTVVTGAVFLASLIGGRPMIGRLADDFWPVTPEMHQNPRITSLFRGLTILWAGAHLAIATVTLLLLLWLPLHTFVVAKQLSGWMIMGTAVALTIAWAHRTACREGFVVARPPGRRRAALPVSVPATPAGQPLP